MVLSDKPAASTFPGEVHGVTRYPSGLPMAEAEVVILSGDADTDRTTVSGSDGTFVFKNLRPGEYQLTARKDGFALSPVTKVDLAYGKDRHGRMCLSDQVSRYPLNSTGRSRAFSRAHISGATGKHARGIGGASSR